MREVLKWFEEVEKEGGYHAYYEKKGMALQGGGAAGGIGITSEFFESILPMQALLRGFLGLTVFPDRMEISPKLPLSLDKLAIDRIRWGDATLSVTAENHILSIAVEGTLPGPITCSPDWKLELRYK